jgi:hypothetical protein
MSSGSVFVMQPRKATFLRISEDGPDLRPMLTPAKVGDASIRDAPGMAGIEVFSTLSTSNGTVRFFATYIA